SVPAERIPELNGASFCSIPLGTTGFFWAFAGNAAAAKTQSVNKMDFCMSHTVAQTPRSTAPTKTRVAPERCVVPHHFGKSGRVLSMGAGGFELRAYDRPTAKE